MRDKNHYKQSTNLRKFTLSLLLFNSLLLTQANCVDSHNKALLSKTQKMINDVNGILKQYYNEIEKSSTSTEQGPTPVIAPEPQMGPPAQESPADHPPVASSEPQSDHSNVTMTHEEHMDMYHSLNQRLEGLHKKKEEVEELTRKLKESKHDKTIFEQYKSVRAEYLRMLNEYNQDLARHTEAGRKLTEAKKG
ncbi:MAG: hypothetical protein FJX71_03850 [Alphaproteobacteria bacterium]|nr:hypothetical protein [Alphaproteobacteria bacterium]